MLRYVPDCRGGGLPFWLLFSSLLHVLVIVFPYLGKTSGKTRSTITVVPNRQPALTATLTRAPRMIAAPQVEPLVVEETLPVLEPERRGRGDLESSHDAPPELAPVSDGLNLLPLPGVAYYATSELTAKPQALGEPALEPAEVVAIAASGKLVLVLWISNQGNVVDASVDSSDLPDVFSQAAVKAFRNLRFVPGELNGQKVGAVMRVEVRYDDARVPPP